MSEWQDIATAPRDGTPVDLWVCEGGFGQRFTDCWAILSNGKPEWWQDVRGDVVRVYATPTHWQPLPTPPNQQRAEGEGE